MVPVPLNRSGLLAPLFRDVEETMAWSFCRAAWGAVRRTGCRSPAQAGL